jgi:hypothetical protein
VADLFDRLAAVATGSPHLAAPRRRTRFEPGPDDAPAPDWVADEQVEVETPVPGPPTLAGPLPAAPLIADRPPSSFAAGPGVGPARDHTTRDLTFAGAGPLQPRGPVAVTEAHTIHEREHVHEVASVERVETSSSIVELVRWIEAAPAPAGGSDVGPARAPGSTGEHEPVRASVEPPSTPPSGAATEWGATRRAARGDEPDERARSVAPWPEREPDQPPRAPEPPVPLEGADSTVFPPRVTVSIDRLEVRTVAEPKPAPAAPPQPVLQFAGPSLDEFLAGRS